MRDFQSRVRIWLLECFGKNIANDEQERNLRFIEESLELVQALGTDKQTVLTMVEHVYSRPQGNRSQEIGGVMVTLAALCAAQGVDMAFCGETEYERIIHLKDKVRIKHFQKPEAIRSVIDE